MELCKELFCCMVVIYNEFYVLYFWKLSNEILECSKHYTLMLMNHTTHMFYCIVIWPEVVINLCATMMSHGKVSPSEVCDITMRSYGIQAGWSSELIWVYNYFGNLLSKFNMIKRFVVGWCSSSSDEAGNLSTWTCIVTSFSSQYFTVKC